MATPPRADPPKPQQQPDHRQSQHQSDEAREKHEAEERQRRESTRMRDRDDEEDDPRKGDEQKRPKRAILPEGQAHQLFYNGHKIAREEDRPTQWLSMGRLGDGTPVVQSPMTPELEQRLKEGKFYLADNVSDDPPAPPARRDPL